MTTGTVVIGRTVPLADSGDVVGSRTEIFTGDNVIGGRVAFVFSGCLVAGSALDPLLVGTGVAMFDKLTDGIGVGTDEKIGNPDVTLNPMIDG